MNKTVVYGIIGGLSIVGMFFLCYTGAMPSEAVAGVATLAVKGFVDAMGKGHRDVGS